jgi:pyrimidine deaminase RibD-like protein
MDVLKIKQEVLQYISKTSQPKGLPTPLEDYLTPLADYPTPLAEYTRPLLDVPPLHCFSDKMAPETHLQISPNDHKAYLTQALSLAQQSPPKSTNYRVGALLLDADTNTILSTGYTLELEGNTHAEQVCFMKLAQRHNLPEEALGRILPENTVLYTTMEPCNMRLSGNLPCVDRILKLGGKIKVVYMGVSEPETFVGENEGKRRLVGAGIGVVHVEGLERRILEVATAGHTKNKDNEGKSAG